MKSIIVYRIVLVCISASMLFTLPTGGLVPVEVATESSDNAGELEETLETVETETSIPETETTVEETTEPETTEPVETEPETETTPETEIETEETTVPEYTRPDIEKPYITLTDEEKRILATLIRLEAGGASYECQMAVGSVVLNRMAAWNKSLEKVVFQKNQFSPAYLINRKYKNGEYCYKPYDICWRVVDDLCENGPTLPYYVLYFRAKHYHKWSIPYCEMDGTYFSYVEKDK